MFLYLFLYLIVVLLYYASQKLHKGAFRWLVLSLVILIPAVFAGCRDEHVGRDMPGYIAIWNSICSTVSLPEALVTVLSGLDPFYITLNFVVSRYTGDIHWLLFVHSFLCISLVVLLCEKLRYKMPSYMLLAFYLLFHYAYNMTMMRQALSIVVGLYSTLMLVNGKIIKSLLLLIFSYFLHSSAIFLLLQMPILLLVNRFMNKRVLLLVIMTVAFIAFYLLFRTLLSSFVGLLGDSFDKYDKYTTQKDYSSHKIDIVLLLGFIFSLIVFLRKKCRIEPYFSYGFFLCMISVFITLLGNYVEVANRAAMYYSTPCFYLLPMSTSSRKNRRLLLFSMTALLLTWYFWLAYTTSFVDAIPYSSKILGITKNVSL